MTIKLKINELITKIMNDKEGKNHIFEIERLEDFSKNCSKYISCIVNMENEINLDEAQVEQAELISTLDKNRISAHEAVISDCKVLNKMSLMYDMDPIYTGDINSDSQISKFAKQYIDELFNERRL